MLNKILFGGEAGMSFAGNAGITLLRIFSGVAMAFGHGASKLPPGEGLIERAGQMGFPAPALFAWAAALSEFGGGILLAIGFLTRISSFFIAVTMIVALVGVHAADPFAAQEKAFLYLFIGLGFLLAGSGDWSVDSYFRKD
ncbi:MAG: DoxX family protein [Acidobacteria bacterium]|nr:DoxX family protein [Acidobacteriota bacterium]